MRALAFRSPDRAGTPQFSPPPPAVSRHVGCSAAPSMRTSSRARVVLLMTIAWALAAATASAQEIFYLRAGSVLSPASPPAGAATASLSTRIPRGEDALLASFTSAPLDHDLVVSAARGVVFLG